jgi:ABC-2 type transport system ATP-binding protein
LSVVETIDLTKVYENGVRALDSLNLRLEGKISCVLGRNGAGKTTLMRILSTQLRPTSGRAYVLGLDVMEKAEEIRRVISSIPQEAKPMGIASPFEHVVMYLTARGVSIREAMERARRSLKEVGLWDFMNTPTDELSGGMKRKVMVAMALSAETEVVFLDEPTTGLDPISRMEVWSAIRSINSKVLLTTHYMEEAEQLCHRIAIIDRGRLKAEGTVEDLLKPLQGKVRVEGVGDIRIGKISISYVEEHRAREMIGKGVTIRPVSLEDVFILSGVQVED